MKYFQFIYLVFVCIQLNEAVERSPNMTTIEKLSFVNFSRAKLLDFLLEQKHIDRIKHLEAVNQLRRKEQRENEIYQKMLANKVQSSFIRDFLTLRYRKNMKI